MNDVGPRFKLASKLKTRLGRKQFEMCTSEVGGEDRKKKSFRLNCNADRSASLAHTHTHTFCNI